jgi:hypothetical protein
LDLVKKYFTSDQTKWPEPLIKAQKGEARVALGLTIIFLDKLLLADTSIPVANFKWVESGDKKESINKRMMIDA